MKKVILLCVFIVLIFVSASYAQLQKIAVLPMKINAAQDYSFLQSGIVDMLSSRLAWKNRLEVIGKTKTLEAVKEYGKELDQQGAEAVGKSLGADYAVFGSLTVLGQSVSIDAKILEVAQNTVVDSVFTQAKTMDEVIPQIDNFAHSINSKVFGRETGAVAEAPKEKAEEPKPEKEEAKVSSPLLAPAYMQSPTEKIKISSLNPAFMLPETAGGEEMVWRSRNLPFAIRGLDVGDIDGDGKNELVVIGPRILVVYRKTEQGLTEMAKMETPRFDFYLAVDVADIDGDGKAEIYASREKGPSGTANSTVYEWVENKLVPTISGSSWYFRVIEFPDEGPGLIGQQKRSEVGFTTTKVHRLRKEGDKIIEGAALNLPRNTYVYNFAYANFQGGVKRIVRINSNDYLEVIDAKGDTLWEADSPYGGTVNYIVKKEENAYTTELTNLLYFPARIVVGDLNNDGETDIIVNKNKSTTMRITERYRVFSSGHIVCLSWQGLGLRENWTTTRIPGYVPDYTLKDLDNDGNLDLVTCLVKMDPTGFKDGNSSVVSFTLKPQDKQKSQQ